MKTQDYFDIVNLFTVNAFLSQLSIYAIPYVSTAMSIFQSPISRSFRISEL